MKKLISLLLVAVLALSLVACGDPATAVSRFVGSWEGDATLSAKTQDVLESELEAFLASEDAKVDAMIASGTIGDTEEPTEEATEATEATEGEATEATEAATEATEAATEATEATEGEGAEEATEATEGEGTEETTEATEAPEADDSEGPKVRVTIATDAHYTLTIADDMTGTLKVNTYYSRKVGAEEKKILKETEVTYDIEWMVTPDNTEGVCITKVTEQKTGTVVADTVVLRTPAKDAEGKIIKDKNGKTVEEEQTVYPLRGTLGLQVRESEGFEFDSTADMTLTIFDNYAEDQFAVAFTVVKLSR